MRESAPLDLTTDADRQLVRAAAGGSPDALSRLYDRYASTVYGLALRILVRVEDAEEVVQDVFAQVWREASRYAPERGSVAAWIVTVARTRAIDWLRSRQARPDVMAGTEPTLSAISAPGPTPEQMAVVAEDGRQVRRALDDLPDEQRRLLELAYYQGLTHSEIAAHTGVPLGTVKTRVRIAMATLRSALAS